MTGFTPAGSLTDEMWMESPMSVPVEVHGDEFRDRIGRAVELDLVAHDVQHAAALDAGRLVLVDEMHRDVDIDLGVLADAQEVDMQREVLDGIQLIVLRQDLYLLAADVDRGDRGQEPAAVDLVENVLVGQGDSQGGCLSP